MGQRCSRPEQVAPKTAIADHATEHATEQIPGGPPSGASGRKPEFVYVLGGAGAGKSTWIQDNLEGTHLIIDPDRLVAICPLDDPCPTAVRSATYLWTKQHCEELLQDALRDDGMQNRKMNYAIIGTGKGIAQEGIAANKAQIILRAKALGFRTRTVYLVCPVEIALERNLGRPRALPEEVVRTTCQSASVAYATLKGICDVCQEYDVSQRRSKLVGQRASCARVSKNLPPTDAAVAWLNDFGERGGSERAKELSARYSRASITRKSDLESLCEEEEEEEEEDEEEEEEEEKDNEEEKNEGSFSFKSTTSKTSHRDLMY